MDAQNLTLFSGRAHPELAHSIARHLGVPPGRINVGCFSDGESSIEILENVRGHDVVLIQPTCPPTNENLMELLVMSDACRRASAAQVVALIPYFGYARQDRRPRAARVPITAKLVADLIAASGIDRVITVDIHADQIQGFFDVPMDNVYASPVLLGDVWKQEYPDMVVVSPDVGGVVRARALAKRLDDADLAIIDKRRPQPNMAEVMNIIGEVKGKTCVLIDDIVDTAGTLCMAGEVLKKRGATRVVAYITHAVLSGPAVDRLAQSELDELVVTDTIPLSEKAHACEKIRQLSVAELLAETLRRIGTAESVSSLYLD
ncbi:MAG: ribose-phosphate diphosphokinase [Gammaproteobacteria bacterium]